MIRIGLMTLVIPAAVCALAACSFFSEEGVKLRLVQSLEQEGQVTYIKVTSGPAGEDARSVDNVWLDLANRRGRVDYADGTIRLADAGMTGDWQRSGAEYSLLERRLSILRTEPDSPDPDPSPLNNPALTVLQPLLSAILWPAPWEYLGDRDWRDRRVSAWFASYPFGDAGEAEATIYVDLTTGLPIGQQLELPASGDVEPADVEVLYDVGFIEQSEIPEDTFDIINLREALLGYGDHPEGGPGYRLLWFGRQVEAAKDLPALTLYRSVVSLVPGEEYTQLAYQAWNRIPLFITAHFGLMKMTIRPRSSWEAYAQGIDDRWWDSADRASTLALGLPTEYVTRFDGRAEVVIWLHDVVIHLESKPLTDAVPPEYYGGVDPRPPGFDRNEFNTEEALVALIPLLREIR